MSKSDPQARIGTLLSERWRIDRLLAQTGIGAVYAATHRIGQRVAIKVYDAQLSVDRTTCERILRGVYAAGAVRHPGAVSVFDDGITEDGSPFLVMELLEGETLEERYKRNGRLAPEEVLRIADEVLERACGRAREGNSAS